MTAFSADRARAVLRAAWGALGLVVLAVVPVQANDSTAELRTGGLVLTRTKDVAMVSEELAISASEVSVRYVFRNLTAADVTTTVAFPVPDIDLAEMQLVDPAIPEPEADNFLGFETKIDGAPAALSIRATAIVRGRDVTKDLERAGVPVTGWSRAAAGAVSALPPGRRADFLRRDILSDATGSVVPAWTVRIAYLREQTFPVGRDVVVEHRYRPSVGETADTALRRPLRDDPARAREYRVTYCVDETSVARVRRLAEAHGRGRSLPERRIAYVLKTGAGWARPIADFTLRIETGGPGVIAATCLAGLREISPGRLELRRRDFTPTADLALLLIGMAAPPRDGPGHGPSVHVKPPL